MKVQDGDAAVNIYLINNTDQPIEVYCRGIGSENAVLEDVCEGGIVTIEGGQKVIVVKAIVAGPGDWYPGSIEYNY